MNNTALALTSAEKKLAPPARTLITDVRDTIAGAVETFKPATRTAFWNTLRSYCDRNITASANGTPNPGAPAKPAARSTRATTTNATSRKTAQRAGKTRAANA